MTKIMEATSEVTTMSALTGGPVSPLSPLSPEGPGIPCKNKNKNSLKHDMMYKSNSALH